MGENDERWAAWQLKDRKTNVELLRSRDRVPERARIHTGERVLDVGCGTGLLALAALPLVGAAGQVVGVDISQAALDACRAAAPDETGTRLRLRRGTATDLPLTAGSFDVVERSVLIYVDDKEVAFAEYRRVLQPHGRLSLFEPINQQAVEEYDFDLRPVQALHDRVEARRRENRRRTNQAMLDFDAGDLVDGLRRGGFDAIDVEIQLDAWELRDGGAWLDQMRRAPNPLASSRVKLVEDLLGTDAERYLAFMSEGVSGAAYRFRCPAAYIAALAR